MSIETFGLSITIIAAIFSVIVLMINNNINRRTLYAQTVSSQRMKWLKTMRNIIYNFICVARKDCSADQNRTSETKVTKVVTDLKNIRDKFLIYMNPNEQEDILDYLDAIIMAVEQNADILHVDALINELIEISQKQLKSEWERVKEEAGKPKYKI